MVTISGIWNVKVENSQISTQVSVDFSKVSKNVIEPYILTYGSKGLFKNVKNENDIERVVNALYSGNLRISRGRPPTKTPLERECERLARVAIHTNARKWGNAWYELAAQKLGIKFVDTEECKMEIRNAAISVKATSQEVMEQARKNLENAEIVENFDLGF